jgi:hypothetical protein
MLSWIKILYRLGVGDSARVRQIKKKYLSFGLTIKYLEIILSE